MRPSDDGAGTLGKSLLIYMTLIVAVLTALLRDFLSGPFAFAMEVSVFTGASVYGAVIHRLQLAALIHEMRAVRESSVSMPGRSLPPETAEDWL